MPCCEKNLLNIHRMQGVQWIVVMSHAEAFIQRLLILFPEIVRKMVFSNCYIWVLLRKNILSGLATRDEYQGEFFRNKAFLRQKQQNRGHFLGNTATKDVR